MKPRTLMARYPKWLSRPTDTYNLREIAPNLFVGSSYAPRYWQDHGGAHAWDTILDFYGSSGKLLQSPELRAGYGRARVVLRLPMFDGDEFPPGALDAAWEAYAAAQGPALLHCQAGLSRSASAGYALVRRAYGLSHDDARFLVTVEYGFPLAATLASARGWVQEAKAIDAVAADVRRLRSSRSSG